jgi:hypothetical protein
MPVFCRREGKIYFVMIQRDCCDNVFVFYSLMLLLFTVPYVRDSECDVLYFCI